MSRIRVLICRVDEHNPETMTQLPQFDLPETDVAALKPETALDALEALTHETGQTILRRVFQAQSDALDATLVAQHRQRFSPSSDHRRRTRDRHRR